MTDELSASSDAMVVSRVLGGEVNAYEVIVRKYSGWVAGIVKNHVPPDQVEEVAHEVFIRAYRNLAGLNNGNTFQYWIRSIAVKTCCDFWRAHYKKMEVPMSALSEKGRLWLETAMAEESDEQCRKMGRQEEAARLLNWAMARLSPKDRMVMNLVYLEGLSGKEAAGLLGWSTANVKVRCFRARKKLEKLLVKPLRI